MRNEPLIQKTIDAYFQSLQPKRGLIPFIRSQL